MLSGAARWQQRSAGAPTRPVPSRNSTIGSLQMRRASGWSPVISCAHAAMYQALRNSMRSLLSVSQVGPLLRPDQPGHQPTELVQRTVRGQLKHPGLRRIGDDLLLGFDHCPVLGEGSLDDRHLLSRMLCGGEFSAEAARIIIDRLIF